MPIYEYQCSDCGNDFELLVKNADEAVECLSCKSPNVKRKLSVFAAKVASPASTCASADACPGAGSSMCGSGCCGLNR
jgi:putative FmdB family regulatory protein